MGAQNLSVRHPGLQGRFRSVPFCCCPQKRWGGSPWQLPTTPPPDEFPEAVSFWLKIPKKKWRPHGTADGHLVAEDLNVGDAEVGGNAPGPEVGHRGAHLRAGPGHHPAQRKGRRSHAIAWGYTPI